jgi:rhodanese-related sulfurtransferase
MRLDPHHPPSYLILHGAAQFGMRQFEEAAATFKRTIRRNPDIEIPFVYLASAYGHMGRLEEADDAIDAANTLRNALGSGELSFLAPKLYAVGAPDSRIDFARFGAKPVRDLVRAGLTDIPSLKWQYLVTVHVVFGSGLKGTWYEVEGATDIDIPTAKSFHDRDVVFIDVSEKSIWNAGHIPGAVHLSFVRTDIPRFSKTALREVAGYDDEIVLYYSNGLLISAWEAAKAITWGYRKVHLFTGGAKAWADAGYPLETGQ